MILLEWALYAVVFVIAVIAAILQYAIIFPMKMSRRERWRTSDWEYMTNRMIATIGTFILVMLTECFVYSYFHQANV
jgi:uncharacterized membrane protein